MSAVAETAISETAFRRFQALMQQVAGIHLPPTKMALVSGRLSRRLRERGVGTFDAYYRLIAGGGEPAELQKAVDLLTTNETYFFREPQHFEFLASEILPAVRPGERFRAWSAASSTGEEAYSIAILMSEALLRQQVRPGVQIFATDIDEQMLQKARAASYPQSAVKDVPIELLDRAYGGTTEA